MKKFVRSASVSLALIMLINCAAVSGAAAEEKRTVRLGGQPFGVRFYNDGVMVVELEDFYSGCRYVCPARDGGLQEGDVIKRINGSPVKTNEEVQAATSGCGGSTVSFTVERGGKELIKTVVPQRNMAGMYLLGAWVRDSCAGIGTVTYYDSSGGYFAALGHGICDSDTGALMPLGSAEVVRASVRSVTKSSAGKAGSLNGYFTDSTLGNLTKNTPCGVFGTTNDNFLQEGTFLELADEGEIRCGSAQMYTTIDGDTAGCYEVEITAVRSESSESNENLVIKVTDPVLLEACGGIVQGMSGSPLVQNGKLVGAVTHVFLNDPEEGYGVTVQNIVSNYLD